MTLKVGLTGNIGSGKSTICKIFSALKVPVFYADEEAKIVLDSPTIYEKLINTFGEKISNENNKIDKLKLASIVFADSKLLQILNNIIHPEVHQRFNEWLKDYKADTYIIMEAAILFESGFDKYVDYTINVHSDNKIRLNRVIMRDGGDTKHILDRMQNQLTDEEKISRSNITIDNNESDLVIPQVLKIHANLKNKKK